MGKTDKSAQSGSLILVCVAMVTGVLMGAMLTSHKGGNEPSRNLQGKMGEVMQLVESKYVDTVDIDSLSEHLVAVMLGELDPHSMYQSARETERTEEMMRGNFEGVGIVLHRDGDTTYVGQVLDGGPSDGVGIMPGDQLLKVDGVNVLGMKSDSVVARLRGRRGTKVKVAVDRCGEQKEFDIRRGVVDHTTLSYSTMLNDTTGYIILSSFAETSYDEFHAALKQLKQRGMRRLIFDLRGNGGGSLSSAIGIANELLPAGSLIVYTQGRHQRRQDVRARMGGMFTQGSVVVMVDEASASASEVVSGALQDNDRALIVGRRTFGKGLVQREFQLDDGSSVLLTTARYYTPSGRCIQRSYDQGTDKYYSDYVQQVIDESYADNPTVHITDSTPYYTVGGRVVYGGGGIYPDKLMPYRKDRDYAYYNQLASQGLFNKVAFEYVRKNAAKMLSQYADAADFVKRFQVDDALLHRLVEAGQAGGITPDNHSLQARRRLMTNMIKANIGFFLFGNDAYFGVSTQEDDDLKQVMKMRI